MKERIAITAPINYLWGILGLSSAIVLIVYGMINGTSINETLKFCILSFVLLIIMVYYIGTLNNRNQQANAYVINNKVVKRQFFNLVLISSYVISLFLIIIIKPNEIIVWMISGLTASILFDMQLGLLLNYNLIIIASFIGDLNIESIIYLVILNTLMCLLSNSMKQTTTIGYVIIIILSVQITLLFIVNNFYIWDAINVDALLSLISSLFTICLTWLIYKKFYDKIVENSEIPGLNFDHNLDTMEDDLALELNTMLTTQEDCKELLGTHSYDEILQPDFPLLMELKNHSDHLYKKFLNMGVLCENAAIAIGAREKVAKAGGTYCEIGLIESKQYVEAGVKLVEDYHMPILVKDIIMQHNMKFDKPQTPEAAIVMFAVSILSTREYLQNKMKDSLSIEKIVENVFQLRLLKGSLDESGLTVEQFNKLKTFFLKI